MVNARKTVFQRAREGYFVVLVKEPEIEHPSLPQRQTVIVSDYLTQPTQTPASLTEPPLDPNLVY